MENFQELNSSVDERHYVTSLYNDPVTSYTSAFTTLRTKTTTTRDSYYDDYYRYIGDMIRAWGPVALVPFGFIGNTLAFIVFSRPRMRSSITAFFFRLLAVFDTLHLAVEVLPQGLEAITNIDMTRVVDWWCKTRYFFAYLTRDVAVWILVLVTIERMLAVVIPHKAKILVTKKRAGAAVFIMFLILLALTVPVAWIIQLGPLLSSKTGKIITYRCFLRGTRSNMAMFENYIWPWIDFWVYSGAPFIIMVLSNITIISTVIKSNYRRRGIAGQSGSSGGGMDSNTRSMTAMLVCVSLAFIVLTAPVCSYWMGTRSNFTVYSGKIKLWFSASKFLAYLNHAINFEIYCLSGRRFREELLHVFHCGTTDYGGSTLSTNKTRLSEYSKSQMDGNSIVEKPQ